MTLACIAFGALDMVLAIVIGLATLRLVQQRQNRRAYRVAFLAGVIGAAAAQNALQSPARRPLFYRGPSPSQLDAGRDFLRDLPTGRVQ
jgi:hypothetical protein